MFRISLVDNRFRTGAEPKYVPLIVINKKPLTRPLSPQGVRDDEIDETGWVAIGGDHSEDRHAARRFPLVGVL